MPWNLIWFNIYKKEISDFLTEPFRQRGGTVTGSQAIGVPPASANHNIENMGRSLDALSLNSGPASTNPAMDPSFPHLKDKLWFYGAITRAECDNLLNQYGQDGDFLVGSSETNVIKTDFKVIHVAYCILLFHLRSATIQFR